MTATQILGILLVALAGLIIGGGVWPMKLMRKLQFEHWWFIGMLVGLVILPWSVTLLCCPNALKAYAKVPAGTLITANLWAAGWGVANVLCGLCFVRIGVALTGAILTGLGVSLGVTLPMIVKGSGRFRDAPGLASHAGMTVLAGVGVMLIGVVFATLAGFGRDRVLRTEQKTSGSFAVGLLMTVIAGILSCGLGLAFVYGQGPVMAAMKAEGAGEIPAAFAVWAACLLGGVLVNVVYPLYLMARNKSFGVLVQSWPEVALAAVIGVNMAAGIVLMGTGMRWLGALGASVGLGIQQASQMLGSQILGFASGEWRGVAGRPRRLMFAAIALLILAGLVMAFGNTMAKS
jgi:L-rhamnose-H+ transport protein